MRLPIRASDWVLCAAPVLTLYVAHLFYGANTYASALALTAVLAALLGLAVAVPGARRLVARSRIPVLVPILFALVLGAALWSLTPWTPGGPHPVWSLVGGAGASSLDVTATVIETVKLLGLACIFAVGAALGGDRDQERRVRQLLLWAGGAFALFAIVAFISRTQPSPGNRLAAYFMSANSAATVFGILTVLAASRLQTLGWFGAGRDLRDLLSSESIAYLGLLLLFVTCVVLTGSRGGLIATIAGLATLGLLQLWRGQLSLRTALGLGALLLILLVGVLVAKGEVALERLGTAHLDGEDRAILFQEHWQAFLRSPLFGYGLGSFPALNQLILTNENHDSMWNVGGLHNVYLQWLEEAGLVGATPMFLLIAVVMIAAVLGLERRRRSVAWIQGLLAANVVVLAHGLTDYALQVPSIAAFWALLLGLQLGAARRP